MSAQLMNRTALKISVAGCLAWAAACPSARASDQPQWGQAWSRNMVSDERGLPDGFDPHTGSNVLWSAELGTETHATPVVAGGRVYLGTNNGHPRDPAQLEDRGVLMCFDARTGHFQWQLTFPKRTEDIYFDWPHSGLCSPVTVEQNRAYVVNNRGEVLCLEVPPESGKSQAKPAAAAEQRGKRLEAEVQRFPEGIAPRILWRFDLPTGAGIWSHDAAHTSILIHDDHLYLNTGTGVDNTHRRIRTPDAPSLIVLDKQTGRLIARDTEPIAPNIFHSTWSAPSLGEVNGRPLVFFAAGNGIVFAFDALTNGHNGSNGIGQGNAPAGRSDAPTLHTPIALHCVWHFDFDPAAPKTNVHRFTTNRRESPSNFYGMPVFYNNRLYVAGGGDIWWGKNEAWLKCIDATRVGDVTTNGLVWSYPLQKHVMSTPAVYRDLVFIADCGPTVHCVDAHTGKPCWTHELKGETWASPLVADGKVFVGTRSGAFYVFAASREKALLSTVELGSPISSTATAANGVLYVATMNHLYAIGQGDRRP
jgi:outer membrane protein assembly factor BamB